MKLIPSVSCASVTIPFHTKEMNMLYNYHLYDRFFMLKCT